MRWSLWFAAGISVLAGCAGKVDLGLATDASTAGDAPFGAHPASTSATSPVVDASPATTNDAPAEAGANDAGTATTAPEDAGTVTTTTADATTLDAMPTYAGCGTAGASFAMNVLPMMAQSCSLTTVCHGQRNNANEENLYLGPSTGQQVPPPLAAVRDEVLAGLVNVRSAEDPSMNEVTPGDLEHSFLWHKVKGDQNTDVAVANGCAAVETCVACSTSAPCGTQQPYLSTSLQDADQCALRDWILQGAQNN
jgi:hypothetical protein